MPKGQLTGMRGVYLVAAELAARGLVVSPTSRSAAGADLLVTDEECAIAFSVQVKTNARAAGFWLVGQKASSLRSDSHLYVFVNIRRNGNPHDYFIVPSAHVASKVRVEKHPRSTWYSFHKTDAEPFRDMWSLLGARA